MNNPTPQGGEPIVPLWSDDDIANDAKRASSNPTVQAQIRSCLLFMRHGYEAKLAQQAARIDALRQELAGRWEPIENEVIKCYHGERIVVSPNGRGVEITGYDKGDWADCTMPDDIRLCRLTPAPAVPAMPDASDEGVG